MVVAYPLDNEGAKVDLTMAYPGLLENFEAAGYRVAALTTSVLAEFPQVSSGATCRDTARPSSPTLPK